MSNSRRPPMHSVFVSSHGSHLRLARQVVRQLRAAGHVVFHDEDSVSPGNDAPTAIRQALADTTRILLIASPGALATPWPALMAVASMLREPQPEERRVMLAIAEPIPDAALPSGLRSLERADFTCPERRDAEYARVLSWLGVTCPADAPPPVWEALAPAGSAVLEPRIVHELPGAPHFVGRDEELRRLEELWDDPAGGVLAIVGIGGAGKTALIQRFLARLRSSPERSLRGLFVWSFYEDSDPGAFLEAAHEYFTGERRPEVKGAGWLHLLKDALSDGQRHLLVLDGLERVQRQERSLPDGHKFGELEDPLLREMLRRLALGAGRAKAVITTRFPVVDLQDLSVRGYRCVDLGQLDERSALSLLRSHGVKGSDRELERLFEDCGQHALTLDHLGSLLGRYFDGRPEWAPLVESPEVASPDRQAHHLASVLRAYEKCLKEQELAALTRLCVLRHGVSAESFHGAFVKDASSAVAGPLAGADIDGVRQLLDALVSIHLVLREGPRRYTVHPAVRDHFYQLFARPKNLHEAASRHFSELAGRPGADLPRDRWALDQLEELVFHLIAAGREAEAEQVYRERLGGVHHLTWLGEFARGLRILSQFRRVIDADGLLRFRRGVGDLPTEEEWERYREDLGYFSVHGPDLTLLLRGRLKESSLSAGQFLRGETPGFLYSHDFAPRFSAVLLSGVTAADLCGWRHETMYGDEDGLESTVHRILHSERFQRYLQEHREALLAEVPAIEEPPLRFDSIDVLLPPEDADRRREWKMRNLALERYLEERFQRLERFVEEPRVRSSPDDMAVWSLWMAELHRSEGDLADARSYLERASKWILRSSSQEHLCLLHLVRARLETDSGNRTEARSALFEGIDISRRCRFNIFLADLLNERARIELLAGNVAPAKEAAREASEIATAPVTGYVWGAALAGHYLACARIRNKAVWGLVDQGRRLWRPGQPAGDLLFERSRFLRRLRL